MKAPWDIPDRKSLDETSGLSRQRRWQLRKVHAGLCQICGKPRTAKGSTIHCPRHAKLHRLRGRKKAA
jgi:hypothetical protein